ncbi:class I SAM-dependent methyltransferase [Allosalinactinospora lopnorensis]|uniref:class I SAM-dependent methyltransferase n=1 Tax=Allosalinactinospora lopnorensis TaxID=1352348 RepID=UPI000623CDE2|nr:class I SAM-dependent methyltransferase [Allosalinactinospora lopnorensis]
MAQETPHDATPNPSQPDAYAGAAIYSKLLLAIYDLYVLRFSMSWIWRCPRRNITAQYRRNVGDRHLDIGVGTGYFLKKAQVDKRSSEIHLLDLNPVPLARASRRVAGHPTKTYEANALEEFPIPEGSLDSVAMSLFLHCVPGDFTQKGVIFDHINRVLRPGGRFFGTTVLAHGVPITSQARRLMAAYQGKGLFNNAGDSLSDLRNELAKRFDDFTLTTRGCVALFEGTAK